MRFPYYLDKSDHSSTIALGFIESRSCPECGKKLIGCHYDWCIDEDYDAYYFVKCESCPYKDEVGCDIGDIEDKVLKAEFIKLEVENE